MRRRPAIRLVITLLAVAIALAITGSASADLGLWFSSPRAHWGERVHVASPGRYAAFSGVRVYLVPMALARSSLVQRPTGPPHNRRIIMLGSLRLADPAVARLSFIVPHVRPGDYTLGFWCKPCAPPAGAFFTTAPPGQRWTPRQHRIVRVSRPASGATKPRTITGHGLAIGLPSGWSGVIYRRVGGLAILHAASLRLPPVDGDDGGQSAVPRMHKNDVLIVLLGVGRPAAASFPPLTSPLRIQRRDLGAPVEGFPLNRAFAGREFRVSGRAFDLWVEFGTGKASATSLREANRVLATLRVRPR